MTNPPSDGLFELPAGAGHEAFEQDALSKPPASSPERSTKAAHYLAALSDDVRDVVSYRADIRGFQRLRTHLQGPVDVDPPDAPWRTPEDKRVPTLFDVMPDAQVLRLNSQAESRSTPGLQSPEWDSAASLAPLSGVFPD